MTGTTMTSPHSLGAFSPGLARAHTFSHKGFRVPDASTSTRRTGSSFVKALLATALFRCWHLLIFFSAWSTFITIMNHKGFKLAIQPTLLTVVGTVLGFVISYRTTSSFERYNEGRRLWSAIIHGSRTFARTVWFHVPDAPPTEQWSAEVQKSRSMIERKTVINLLQAYGVAVKHYLRGEDGIYYQDLYYLVKFLPAYALPPGIPSHADLEHPTEDADPHSPGHGHEHSQPTESTVGGASSFLFQRRTSGAPPLPAPVTDRYHAPALSTTATFVGTEPSPTSPDLFKEKNILARSDENYLMPARMPPKYHVFDVFPLSLFARCLTKRGKAVKGRKAARIRAKMRNKGISHNLPLEISLYLSSYIAALQRNKVCDVPTTNTLLAALNQLVDSLTGLERILTTPIPFSYSIHLWVVTIIYCLALPFQIWATLKWITIPGTTVASFIFFGFLVAGEEIENPFGYDKNDLNLDHFTGNIIRQELLAITGSAPPDPALWAFSAENDLLFGGEGNEKAAERVTPDQWMQRGHGSMQEAMRV